MMLNKIKLLAAVAITLLAAHSATALAAQTAAQKKALLDRNNFSIGAGVSYNSIDGYRDDEVGFQFFGDYDLSMLNLMDGVNTSVEFGYMDYGFNNSDGVWATMVADGTLSGDLGWLARLGFDFGDDDGVMFGAGLGYKLNQRTNMRFEYVVRDEVNSIQLNLLFRL